MSASRAAAQLFRMAVSLEYFIPPATARAGTAQRAIPTIARHIPLSPASLTFFFETCKRRITGLQLAVRRVRPTCASANCAEKIRDVGDNVP